MRATGCAFLRRAPRGSASRFVSPFSRQLSSRHRCGPALIATHQAKVPTASRLLQPQGALRPCHGGAAPLDLSRGVGVWRLLRAAPASAADEARAPASAADEARLIPRFLDAPRHLTHAIARLLADLAVAATAVRVRADLRPPLLCAQVATSAQREHILEASIAHGARTAGSTVPEAAVRARGLALARLAASACPSTRHLARLLGHRFRRLR